MNRAFRSLTWLISPALFSCSVSSPKPVSHEDALPKDFLAAEQQRDAARFFSSTNDLADERGYDVQSYFLKGFFDWDSNRLFATVDISLKQSSPDASIVTLDSKVTAVKNVRWKDQMLPFSVESEKGLLHIDTSAVSNRTNTFLISIQYEAQAGSSLRAIPRRGGDPVSSRVVYTVSEPEGAALWMPCNNRPSDRALFSTEFSLPEGERLVANGHLKTNVAHSTTRKMGFATEYTLPTYLMAFAVGEFTESVEYRGALPISIVARRGLPVDYDGLLAELNRQISQFEKLLVPYPYEKYSVVLLPDFPSGGIEHAGISFQGETRSTRSKIYGDINLMAHELAHQWFGDLVTIQSWDDLWVKEGMATLLASEAMRPYEDQKNSGRLFGSLQAVTDGEAMRDVALKPGEKYTSGPYGRAAWFLTQIRASVGEENFWNAVRSVLISRRNGNIDSAGFLESFRKYMSPEKFVQAQKSIDAKALPKIDVVEEGTAIKVTLLDPEATMLVPLDYSIAREGGVTETRVLQNGISSVFSKDGTDLLQFDKDDIHLRLSKLTQNGFDKLAQLLAPRSENVLATFLKEGPAAHISVIESGQWSISPKDFAFTLPRLGSERAKHSLLALACRVAALSPNEEWKAVISTSVQTPHTLGITSAADLTTCRPVLNDTALGSDWSFLKNQPTYASKNEDRLVYLSSFVGTAAFTYQTWMPIAASGASIRSRELALKQITKHIDGTANFEKPTDAELSTWKENYRSILRSSEVGEVLKVALRAVKLLKDTEALPYFENILKNRGTLGAHRDTICTAYALIGETQEHWKDFVANVAGSDALTPSSVKLLQDPKACL